MMNIYVENIFSNSILKNVFALNMMIYNILTTALLSDFATSALFCGAAVARAMLSATSAVTKILMLSAVIYSSGSKAFCITDLIIHRMMSSSFLLCLRKAKTWPSNPKTYLFIPFWPSSTANELWPIEWM